MNKLTSITRRDIFDILEIGGWAKKNLNLSILIFRCEKKKSIFGKAV